MQVSPPVPGGPVAKPIARNPDADLRRAAQDIEAGFLTEMLKHAGMDENSDSFGGGVGEEQFSSFLREEQARAIVKKGGVGLAEQIFLSMKRIAENG